MFKIILIIEVSYISIQVLILEILYYGKWVVSNSAWVILKGGTTVGSTLKYQIYLHN